jgi:hypothetical protein
MKLRKALLSWAVSAAQRLGAGITASTSWAV